MACQPDHGAGDYGFHRYLVQRAGGQTAISVNVTRASHRPAEVAAFLAFPLFDCEIGDADTELFVDARLNQRGSFNPADWSRAAHPAVDVCGELPGRRATRSFKTSDAASMPHLLADLRDATPDSWLPISTVET